jgi:peptide/nickel transport system permease protein
MLVVALVSFSLFRFVGDPVATMMGQEASIADREALRDRLGLNDPVIVQFAGYIGRALTGDFGISYRLQQPVAELILSRLPATLELALISGLLAFVTGVGLGRLHGAQPPRVAVERGDDHIAHRRVAAHLPDRRAAHLDLRGRTPVAAVLRTRRGRGLRLVDDGASHAVGRASLVLPAITLGLYQMTLIMRLVRAEMLEVLRTDYVKFARARGLSNRAVNFGHALKNTMVPVITITGLQLGSIIAFAIITETVFQWPGVGALFINSVQFVDVPVMAAYLMLIALGLRADQPDRRSPLLRRRPAPPDRPDRAGALSDGQPRQPASLTHTVPSRPHMGQRPRLVVPAFAGRHRRGRGRADDHPRGRLRAAGSRPTTRSTRRA